MKALAWMSEKRKENKVFVKHAIKDVFLMLESMENVG